MRVAAYIFLLNAPAAWAASVGTIKAQIFGLVVLASIGLFAFLLWALSEDRGGKGSGVQRLQTVSGLMSGKSKILTSVLVLYGVVFLMTTLSDQSFETMFHMVLVWSAEAVASAVVAYAIIWKIKKNGNVNKADFTWVTHLTGILAIAVICGGVRWVYVLFFGGNGAINPTEIGYAFLFLVALLSGYFVVSWRSNNEAP